MSVYVDDVRLRFGRMIMCHMWADSDEELLEMARRIGVDTKWIQGHPTLSFGKHRNASWVHFDISLGKKELAIKAGAILTDRFGPVMHTARLRLASAKSSGDHEGEAQAQKLINSIERMRSEQRDETST